MADENSERQGLHQLLRSQMAYGTAAVTSATKKTTPRTRKLISHQLLRTDTLMGIALKYGVSAQDLKKENKIWNNDHLFLRETILIPLTAENESALDENDIIVVLDGASSSTSSPSSSQSHVSNGEDPGSTSTSSVAHADGTAASSVKARSMSTPTDFFSKYDTTIAQLKGDVAKMEQNAAPLDQMTDAVSLAQRRGSGLSGSSTDSSSIQRREQVTADGDNIDSPTARPLSSSKHIQSALENLQQISDDIYQL